MFRILLLVTLSLSLIGCSSTRLAYHQIGWWAPWVAREYVPLDRGQRGLMRSRVQSLRDWHCAREMPRYSQTLQQLREELGGPPPTAAELAGWLEQAQAAYQSLAQRMAPAAAELLATLDDSQVESLRENLAEKNRELEKKYREPALEDQIQERQERLIERLEKLFGPVNDQQRSLVGNWSQTLGNHNENWLDNRYRWQGELFAALEKRDQESRFSVQLAQLLESPRALYSPGYAEQSAWAREQGITLAANLLRSADREQMAHLDARLADWQSLLESLSCG
ncbi:MAG: DUF6279 family lipoprotein [Oleiphilaceae bacterium]|nr:DUF6279 family lipoprotein [Oleiphilaceae bacterium]